MKEPKEPLFSILIPTWNNLEFLKLCVRGLRRNSHFEHQIIVHVNEGTDGTLEWVASEKLEFTVSRNNRGVCLAINQAATLARTDYIGFMNDDMYACPDWDLYLWKEIESLDTPRFFLSSTVIEPVESRNRCVIAPYHFGDSPSDFEEERLLEMYDTFPKKDWSGATWPPNVLPRALWHLVGGYSIEFSPGMYSDPDFSMKLWEAGVRTFKGVARSRVYHFMSKSSGRIPEVRNGRMVFLDKWGISASTFTRFYLRRGEDYQGPLTEPRTTIGLRWAVLKSRLSKLLWSLRTLFGD